MIQPGSRESIFFLAPTVPVGAQGTPAINENRKNSIMIDDYLRTLEKGGWEMTHFIQAPMSSERFQANVVAAMQKKKILGVTSRYVIVAKKLV